MLKVAIAQMQTSQDLRLNLAKMKELVEKAKVEGAQLIAFPEMAYLMADKEVWISALPKYQDLLKEFASMAKIHSIGLIPGSLREPIPKATDRFYNTLPVFDSNGKLVAVYRKIFLFKATLPDRKYDEALYCNPGNRPMIGVLGGTKVGLSTCFDLRFPELYRELKRKGARLFLVPSAFTIPTGTAHWHVLLRARAIENQVYVLAPGQVGRAGDGAEKYGHSLIVSPWGDILVDMENKEGIRTCALDLNQLDEVRTKVDAWACRRDDVFQSKRS